MQTSIFAPVKDEIARVDNCLKEVASVEYPWLAELLAYIVETGGKRVRPALTLLSGKFYRNNLDVLVPMAAGMELLHTATLVHDDTIDSSMMRRGKATATSIWGAGVATLTGDYLFAKSAALVTSTGSIRATKLFAQTLVAICSGELEQNFISSQEYQTRESYFRRIGNKTAALFSTAAESGAILSEAPERAVQALKCYGYNLGMAFQIVDDILDFVGEGQEMGKPVGSDLSHGTVTLPAILLTEKRPGDNPINQIFEGRDKDQNVALAIRMICSSDIIPESYRIAETYTAQARQSLDMFPDNIYRRTMIDITDYVVQRRK